MSVGTRYPYRSVDSDPEPRYELATPNLARISDEIRNGMPNERQRLGQAVKNLDFFEGRFDAYQVRPPNTTQEGQRFERHSLMMRRIVYILTANLYKNGPIRRLPEHPQAEEWLENIYRRHLIDARWQQADRYSLVSDVAAFQATGNADPDCPVKIQLWDASSFTAWSSPDDPTEVVAVATLDRYDERMRVKLWTDEILQTWLSDKIRPNQVNAAKNYKLVSEDEHPYVVVPFSFAHVELPVNDFWNGGFGSHLSQANDSANFLLTQIHDCVRYNLRPVITVFGTRPGWRPRAPIMPGDIWDPPPDTSDETSSSTPDPRISYLESNPASVAASWDDLQQYLDHTLEMVGVPPSSIRMEQRSAMSGVAIVSEQIPIILWALSRQRPFSHYEDRLAKLVLKVGAAHLADNGVSAGELEAAAADPGLVLNWPEMYPDLPGPERDQADQWLLENNLASRTQILMRRERLTHDEAEARLEQIAEDQARENEIFGAVGAAPAALPAAAPADLEDLEDDDQDDDLEEDGQDDAEDDDNAKG